MNGELHEYMRRGDSLNDGMETHDRSTGIQKELEEGGCISFKASFIGQQNAFLHNLPGSLVNELLHADHERGFMTRIVDQGSRFV